MNISSYIKDGRTHQIYTSNTSPTLADHNSEIGTKWFNTVSQKMYICVGKTENTAEWAVYKDNVDTLNTISVSSAPSGAIEMDCSLYDMFILYDFDDNVVLDLANFETGRSINIVIEMTGGYTVDFGSDVYWIGGEQPALTDGSTNMDTFILTKIESNRVHASGVLEFTGAAYTPPAPEAGEGFATEPEALSNPVPANMSFLTEEGQTISGYHNLDEPYLALELNNMTLGKTYDVDVSSGDGTIDMQGWDGTHDGGTRTVVLNGSGPQTVDYSRIVLGDPYPPQDFTTPLDPTMWARENNCYDNNGYIDFKVGRNYPLSSGGALSMLRRIKPNTDFNVNFVFSNYHDGGHQNHDLQFRINLYENTYDSFAELSVNEDSGYNPNKVSGHIKDVNGTINYGIYNSSGIDVYTVLTGGLYFRRAGNQLTIGFGSTGDTLTETIDPSIELRFYLKLSKFGTMYNTGYVWLDEMQMPDGPLLLTEIE